jgi:hypothetical protein
VTFVIDDLDWEGTPEELRGPGAARLPAVLDSQDLMELAAFVETEFDVEIDDAEINADNFGTLAALTDFVVAKAARD